MTSVRFPSLAAANCILLTVLTASSADAAKPKRAWAFHDSIGGSTHIVYYSTAYGDRPRSRDRTSSTGSSAAGAGRRCSSRPHAGRAALLLHVTPRRRLSASR